VTESRRARETQPQFIPIEREVSPEFIEAHWALAWYVLIKEMEEFRQQTGWDLALTWAYVHRQDYTKARRSFEELRKLGETEPDDGRADGG
jgi:hypothetical protein